MARKVASTGYWTFFCNPNFYDIDKRLEEGDRLDGWGVTPWQAGDFLPGQLGVVRVGKDHRPSRLLAGRRQMVSGVYSVVEILDEVQPPDNVRDPYWIHEKPSRAWVPIRHIHNLVHAPLSIAILSRNPAIAADPYLVRGFQATSMPLLPGAFKAILEMIGYEEPGMPSSAATHNSLGDSSLLRKSTGILLGVSIEGRHSEVGLHEATGGRRFGDLQQDATRLDMDVSLGMEEDSWIGLLNAEVDVLTKGGKVIRVAKVGESG